MKKTLMAALVLSAVGQLGRLRRRRGRYHRCGFTERVRQHQQQ